MTKYLSKLVVEKFLNLVKNMYRRTMTNIILNGGKLESFLLRLKTRSECPLPLQLFNILLKVLANAIKKKEIKDI